MFATLQQKSGDVHKKMVPKEKRHPKEGAYGKETLTSARRAD
jgi:hypothetical protein